jgi:hypothetical protein
LSSREPADQTTGAAALVLLAEQSFGLALGAVLEASILMEAGGGTGTIDFTTANVTAQ